MNAGIADAASLAWLMAADLNQWGGSGMLDAYEKERLPITEQVSRFAMNYAVKMIKTGVWSHLTLSWKGRLETKFGPNLGKSCMI